MIKIPLLPKLIDLFCGKCGTNLGKGGMIDGKLWGFSADPFLILKNTINNKQEVIARGEKSRCDTCAVNRRKTPRA